MKRILVKFRKDDLRWSFLNLSMKRRPFNNINHMCLSSLTLRERSPDCDDKGHVAKVTLLHPCFLHLQTSKMNSWKWVDATHDIPWKVACNSYETPMRSCWTSILYLTLWSMRFHSLWDPLEEKCLPVKELLRKKGEKSCLSSRLKRRLFERIDPPRGSGLKKKKKSCKACHQFILANICEGLMMMQN